LEGRAITPALQATRTQKNKLDCILGVGRVACGLKERGNKVIGEVIKAVIRLGKMVL